MSEAQEVVGSPERAAERLTERAEIALDALAEMGGGEHEICAQQGTTLRSVYERDDFTVSASDAVSVYGVRSIVDGKPGFATTNAERLGAMRDIAREARRLAELSMPSEHQQILASDVPLKHAEVVDGALLGIGPDALHGYLNHVVGRARSDERVALDRAEFSCTLTTGVLVNSKGVRRSAARAACHWNVMGMARTGDEISSFDYDGSEVARWGLLEPEIERSIGAFQDSVLGSLGARAGRTYRGKVLLHPSATMALVGEFVRSNCVGLNHVDGVSPWAGRVGEQVASRLLRVSEDPHETDLGGWAIYDREGQPTGPHVLVDQGVLSFVAHNAYSAHRAGVASTGNAVGGPTMLPGTGFMNFTIAGTETTKEAELARELGAGLVVKRFSGNVDPQSGQFSGTAKNSWWVDGGECSHPVHEVMIAGNLTEALKRIVAVGDVLHTLQGSARAPYLLLDGVSVTAG